MAERMLKFVTVSRTTPEKRAAGERLGDFHEIYADFIDAKAKEQASRLFAMRHSVLPDALSAAQQHPRLAADDGRGPAAGSL